MYSGTIDDEIAFQSKRHTFLGMLIDSSLMTIEVYCTEQDQSYSNCTSADSHIRLSFFT